MKALHILVIVLFVLTGLPRGIVGIAELAGVKAADLQERAGQGRYMQVIDGFEDVAFGCVYMIAAIGLLKFNRLARLLAAILLLWNLFGALSNTFEQLDFANLSWLGLTILVSVWFLLPSVRAKFVAANEGAKAA